MQVLSHEKLRGDHIRTIGDAVVQEGKTLDLSSLFAPAGSKFITEVYNLAEATAMMEGALPEGAVPVGALQIGFPAGFPPEEVVDQAQPSPSPTQQQLRTTAQQEKLDQERLDRHVAEAVRQLAARVALHCPGTAAYLKRQRRLVLEAQRRDAVAERQRRKRRRDAPGGCCACGLTPHTC
jgi:hypothetical protein